MSDTLPQRPTFSNGQYIGADDLNAAVDYARDKTERLALSGRSWGIAAGLALVEITDASGATQMYIEPGVAWDGYGRAIVVISEWVCEAIHHPSDSDLKELFILRYLASDHVFRLAGQR